MLSPNVFDIILAGSSIFEIVNPEANADCLEHFGGMLQRRESLDISLQVIYAVVSFQNLLIFRLRKEKLKLILWCFQHISSHSSNIVGYLEAFIVTTRKILNQGKFIDPFISLLYFPSVVGAAVGYA